MVGLQACAQSTGQADGGAESGRVGDGAGDGDEVLVAHQLGDRGHHLRGQTGCERRQLRASVLTCRGVEQPVAKPSDGQVREGFERRRVVAVDDQPGDLVVLVGDQDVVQESGQRDVGEHPLRGGTLAVRVRGAPGELVTRSWG